VKLTFNAAPQLLDEINRGSGGNVDLQVKYDYLSLKLSLVCVVCSEREEIAWNTPVNAAVVICQKHRHKEHDQNRIILRESTATIEIDGERKYKDLE
jgi:hypothetical protein